MWPIVVSVTPSSSKKLLWMLSGLGGLLSLLVDGEPPWLVWFLLILNLLGAIPPEYFISPSEFDSDKESGLGLVQLALLSEFLIDVESE